MTRVSAPDQSELLARSGTRESETLASLRVEQQRWEVNGKSVPALACHHQAGMFIMPTNLACIYGKERKMGTPYAYFRKQFVPLEDAKIGIMTHAFNYGTGVFEGIRGNWNAEDNTIYLFKVEEHLKRLRQSARICRIEI